MQGKKQFDTSESHHYLMAILRYPPIFRMIQNDGDR